MEQIRVQESIKTTTNQARLKDIKKNKNSKFSTSKELEQKLMLPETIFSWVLKMKKRKRFNKNPPPLRLKKKKRK